VFGTESGENLTLGTSHNLAALWSNVNASDRLVMPPQLILELEF